MKQPEEKVKCVWCGKTYDEHRDTPFPGGEVAKTPCGLMKSGFYPQATPPNKNMRDIKNRFYSDITEFMDKHRRADELVFSEVSGYPLKAIYYCPPVKYTEDELEGLSKLDPRIERLIDMLKQISKNNGDSK